MTRVNADRIVLVHGFTQTASSWRPTVARLTASLGPDVDVVALDAPGHGDRGDVRADLPTRRRDARRGGRACHVRRLLDGRAAVLAPRPRIAATRRSAGADRDDTRDRGRAGTRDPPRRRRRVGRRDRTHRSRRLRRSLVVAAAVRRPRPLGRRPRDTVSTNTAAGLASSLRLAGTGTQTPLWTRLGELDDAGPHRSPASTTHKFTEIGRRMAEAIADASLAVIAGAGHAVQLRTTGPDVRGDRDVAPQPVSRRPPTRARTACRRRAAPDRSLRARRSTPGRSHGRPPLGLVRRRPEPPAP